MRSSTDTQPSCCFEHTLPVLDYKDNIQYPYSDLLVREFGAKTGGAANT